MNYPTDTSLSPHIHSGNSIRKDMLNVMLALLPAYLVGLYFFGMGALIVSLTAIASCVLLEYLIQRFLLKGTITITNGSAALTGLLLSMTLPSNLPVWQVIIGSTVAIGIAKMSFGGIGNNIFNPALSGRVFLLISFPAQMTVWPKPILFNTSYTDAVTAATPLANLKGQFAAIPDIQHLLIGNMGGSLGEVSALALLLGLVWLLAKKIISWHIPVSIVATVYLFTTILHFSDPERFTMNPLTHILTGGLLLGAIFMATDYVTSPMSGRGMLIYGIGIGIITVIIRIFGTYPEGVSFAILLMNGATPFINTYVKPRRFSPLRK